MDRAEEILKRLIAIPSVNPEDTPDTAITGEGRLADFVASELEARGLRVDLEEVAPGRPNVIAESCPDDGRCTLLLEAHLDTVSVAGMTIDPFKPEERDGRIWGRGACDDKGPMAASLAALTRERVNALAAAGIRVVYIAAMGEEKGNQGAKWLVARNRLRADQIVVLEPTDLEIVHTHKGVMWIDLMVQGRAVHGSEPERGVSAIDGAVAVMALLKQRVTEACARHGKNPVLGYPTVNVGRIEGGSQVNIVPAACRLQVDRRLVPGESAAEVHAALEADLRALCDAGRLLDFTIRVAQQGNPFATDPGCHLVQGFQQSLAACGVTPRLAGAAWYSDAGPLSALCPDVIVFGPGSIRQAHTADEFIEIESLRTGAQVLGEWLDRTAREGV